MISNDGLHSNNDWRSKATSRNISFKELRFTVTIAEILDLSYLIRLCFSRIFYKKFIAPLYWWTLWKTLLQNIKEPISLTRKVFVVQCSIWIWTNEIYFLLLKISVVMIETQRFVIFAIVNKIFLLILFSCAFYFIVFN